MANINQSTKKRNWAFVVYPESAPENWLDLLGQTGLPVALSPLHDKDKNPDDTEKKPHWHAIVCYGGPTSYNVVKRLTDQLNAPIPQALEAVRGYYRYLTHKDNPEKYQYSERDIKTLNGFNISDFVELTKSEVLKIKRDLLDLIRKEKIYEYSQLLDYLESSSLITELEVACNNTFMLTAYLSSRRHMSTDRATPPASLAKEAGNGHD